MRKVLVAIDATSSSERAAAFVNDFFAGLEVEIIGVNVGRLPLAANGHPALPGAAFSWPYAGAPTGPEALTARRAAGEHAMRESGLDADREIPDEVGLDVAETLRRVVEECGADLLVVGESERSLFSRLFDPSVSRELMKHAPVPVLLVR